MLRRIDANVLRRVEAASNEELLRLVESGSGDERRQAAIELGDRHVPGAFDILAELPRCPDFEVADGAALGLAELNDHRAIQPLVDAIEVRMNAGEDSMVPVFALTEFAAPQVCPLLSALLCRGKKDEARHAGRGLLDTWDVLEPADRAIVVAALRQCQDEEIEEWRRAWIAGVLGRGSSSSDP